MGTLISRKNFERVILSYAKKVFDDKNCYIQKEQLIVVEPTTEECIATLNLSDMYRTYLTKNISLKHIIYDMVDFISDKEEEYADKMLFDMMESISISVY